MIQLSSPMRGHAGVLRRAEVEGAELADRVAVADLELGRLAGVLLVLRRARRASRTGRCGCRGRSSCGLRSRSAGRSSCRRRCARRAPITAYGADLDRRRPARRPGSTMRGRVDRRHRAAPVSVDRAHRAHQLGLDGQSRRRRWRAALNLKMPAFMRSSVDVEHQLVARLDRALEARARRCRRSSRPIVVGLGADVVERRAAPPPGPAPRASARRASPAGAGSGRRSTAR